MYTEKDLHSDAEAFISAGENKYNFVLCSSTNIDSIASFYHAAIDANKVIAADKYQCSNLKIVEESVRQDPNYSSLYDFSFRTVYTYNRKNEKLRNYMENVGFCMFIRAKPFFEEVIKSFPDNNIIYSMWDGYLKEGKPYTDHDLIKFLKTAETNGSKVVPMHTSGHAYEEAIIEVCDIVDPKFIFPIHSEKPGRFEELKKEGKIQGEVRRFKGQKDTVEI
jgi:ribonuclease J